MALIALAPAQAEAFTKRIKVPAESIAHWTTPQQFGSHEVLVIRVWIGGKEVKDTAYQDSRCAAGWAARGVLVEAEGECDRASSLTFDFASIRERPMWVKIRYRRYQS